jgi:hypothetical protein
VGYRLNKMGLIVAHFRQIFKGEPFDRKTIACKTSLESFCYLFEKAYIYEGCALVIKENSVSLEITDLALKFDENASINP